MLSLVFTRSRILSTELSSVARNLASKTLSRHITTTTAAVVAMSRPKIKLYVDVVSPFAYLAYYILRHHDVFKACDVSYVPILLGGLLQKCGNAPPVRVKNKDKWIAAERLRWAEAFAVPTVPTPPPDFPAPTLPLMRAMAVLADEDAKAGDESQTRLVKALDEFYAQHWAKGVAVHRPEVMREVLVGVFGEEEAEKVLTAIPTRGKSLLHDNTDAAFADGAFGLPWMVCTNTATGETQGFFGVDHLGQVAQFLGLERPVDGEKEGAKGWRAVL